MASTQALRSPRVAYVDSVVAFLQSDLTRPLPFAVLAAVFLLVRAPFLDYGYGTDPDAWRVALTGEYLWQHGDYFPSRLPGNPLHELAVAPFVPIGWLATNLVTALVSLVGVYLFARIAQELRLPNRALLTIGFAFTPLLVINSVATMDYMWTLTAVLAAYYATLRGWPVWAGVCLGLAVGFRLNSAIVWLPLAYLLWRRGDLWAMLPFSLAAGGVAVLAFAPVLAAYGLDFLNFYDASVDYEVVIRLLGKEALGVTGALAVVLGVLLSLRQLRSLPSDALTDPQVGAWLLLIGLYVASFLRLPHEIAYLIPVFPFGLFLLGRYLRTSVLVGVVFWVLVAGLVDVTTPGEGIGLGDLRQAGIGRGLLLSNVDTMNGQRDFVDAMVEADLPDHSVVIAGFIYPQLAMRERDRLDLRILERDYEAISMLSDRGEAVDEEGDRRYVWLLRYDAFLALRSQGYSFFLVPDAETATGALYDYRPALFGASYLKLDGAAPGAGRGTAETDR
jgi:hypothetical protein